MFRLKWWRKKEEEAEADLLDVVSIPRNSVAEEDAGAHVDPETATTGEMSQDLVQVCVKGGYCSVAIHLYVVGVMYLSFCSGNNSLMSEAVCQG